MSFFELGIIHPLILLYHEFVLENLFGGITPTAKLEKEEDCLT